jgi:putative membrane protein
MTTLTYGVRSRRRHPSAAGAALAWLLAGTTVALEIAYPLVDAAWLHRVTIATVVVFASTCVVHATVHRGARWALGLVVVTAGGGLAAEAVGVRTGLPFGDYSYAGTLGPEVLGVPLVVPLAWTMMAYPVLLAARRLTRRWVVPVGAFGLMAWDVFLDPQMVGDGHWSWADPTPALPGVPGIPLTDFAGWLLVGALMMLVLGLVLPRDDPHRPADESLPATLLGWTWLGYVLGNVFWFGTSSVALVGGVLLGLLVLPYVWSLWQSRP